MNIIMSDLDGTLAASDIDPPIYWDVVECVRCLQKQLGIPVALVTARFEDSAIGVADAQRTIRRIKEKTGWAPDYFIAERRPDERVSEYKVRALVKHGLRPVVAIDDMIEVLEALHREFGAIPIQARDGRLTRIRVEGLSGSDAHSLNPHPEDEDDGW